MKIKWSLYLLSLLFFFEVSSAQAGRPVYQKLNRNELIERSNFVFAGWPSSDKTPGPCPSQTGRWWVHKVYRGDKSMENKVIALAEHNYHVFNFAKTGHKHPSYAASTYKTGTLNREQSTSFLFTNRRSDGCFELTADGAQEHRFAEPEIEALFANQSDCPKNLRGFEHRASNMPLDCKTSSDCKIYYVHPNSCGRPYVWSLSAQKEINEEFVSLQSRARNACAKDWQKQPACSPQVFPIKCQANRCAEGPPDTLPAATLRKGIISESCAPHDASSMLILVRPEDNSFPLLSLNWWGATRPHRNGKAFNFSGEGDLYAKGVQASYCPYKGSCKQFSALKIKFMWIEKDNKARIDFDGALTDGEKISGQATIQYQAPESQIGCG